MTWPFDQPRNCATIVSKSILDGARPIMVVCHDEDDHGWQFLDGLSERVEDLAIVGLGHILDIDPTMRELARIEPGYEAVRAHVGDAWAIERIKDEPINDSQF